MVKNYKFIASSVTAALVATALTPVAGATLQISDYKDQASIAIWAKEAVTYVTEKGIMQGYNNLFSPQRALTRGEAAKMIAVSLGLVNLDKQLDIKVETSFKDTKDHWSAPYIKLLQDYDKDIISGYTDGTFKPNQVIRRDELAKIVVTASKLTANDQVKVILKDSENWAKEYIHILASQGIVIGSGEGYFNPEENVTRESAAVFVHRTLEESVRVPADKNPSVEEIIPPEIDVEEVFEELNGLKIEIERYTENLDSLNKEAESLTRRILI